MKPLTTKKTKIVYIGIAKNLYVRAKQEMGWSNLDAATFVRKTTFERGHKNSNKYNKKIQADVHEYIIANFRIECKPYKGRKTDYQEEIKPAL